MKSISVSPESAIHLIDIAPPSLEPDGLIAKTIGCGVCGTDLLKINLKLLKTDTVLGHEWIGEVLAVGQNVTEYSVGDWIVSAHHIPCGKCHYCRHNNVSMCSHFKKTNFRPGGFAEQVALSGEHLDHTTFKIQKSDKWAEFIFTEPLACCVRNYERLNLLSGDVVVIVGLGSIGLMTGALFAHNGVKVIGVDLDATRAAFAKDFGFTETHTGFDEQFQNTLKKLSESRGADAVVFTAGPASLLNTALSWVRDGGTLNLFSHLSGESAPIDTASLYHREINIVSSYSASPDSLKKAFALLDQDALNLRRLFAPAFAPEGFEEAVKKLNQREIYKALVTFL